MDALAAFRLLAPSFAAVADEHVLAMMEIAATMYDAERLPEKVQPTALAYMTAHLLHGQTMGGAVGAVQSEKEGDLSRSYAVSSSLDGLMSDRFGQAFDALWRGYGGANSAITRAMI